MLLQSYCLCLFCDFKVFHGQSHAMCIGIERENKRLNKKHKQNDSRLSLVAKEKQCLTILYPPWTCIADLLTYNDCLATGLLLLLLLFFPAHIKIHTLNNNELVSLLDSIFVNIRALLKHALLFRYALFAKKMKKKIENRTMVNEFKNRTAF